MDWKIKTEVLDSMVQVYYIPGLDIIVTYNPLSLRDLFFIDGMSVNPAMIGGILLGNLYDYKEGI